jgi:hypothetical protein
LSLRPGRNKQKAVKAGGLWRWESQLSPTERSIFPITDRSCKRRCADAPLDRGKTAAISTESLPEPMREKSFDDRSILSSRLLSTFHKSPPMSLRDRSIRRRGVNGLRTASRHPVKHNRTTGPDGGKAFGECRSDRVIGHVDRAGGGDDRLAPVLVSECKPGAGPQGRLTLGIG